MRRALEATETVFPNSPQGQRHGSTSLPHDINDKHLSGQRVRTGKTSRSAWRRAVAHHGAPGVPAARYCRPSAQSARRYHARCLGSGRRAAAPVTAIAEQAGKQFIARDLSGEHRATRNESLYSASCNGLNRGSGCREIADRNRQQCVRRAIVSAASFGPVIDKIPQPSRRRIFSAPCSAPDRSE